VADADDAGDRVDEGELDDQPQVRAQPLGAQQDRVAVAGEEVPQPVGDAVDGALGSQHGADAVRKRERRGRRGRRRAAHLATQEAVQRQPEVARQDDAVDERQPGPGDDREQSEAQAVAQAGAVADEAGERQPGERGQGGRLRQHGRGDDDPDEQRGGQRGHSPPEEDRCRRDQRRDRDVGLAGDRLGHDVRAGEQRQQRQPRGDLRERPVGGQAEYGPQQQHEEAQ